MADPVDADAIAANANSPASAAADGVSAEQVPIPDQIAAAKYKAASDALAGGNAGGGSRSGWRGLRAGRAVPPGAS